MNSTSSIGAAPAPENYVAVMKMAGSYMPIHFENGNTRMLADLPETIEKVQKVAQEYALNNHIDYKAETVVLKQLMVTVTPKDNKWYYTFIDSEEATSLASCDGEDMAFDDEKDAVFFAYMLAQEEGHVFAPSNENQRIMQELLRNIDFCDFDSSDDKEI